jgi:hypothetical protein
MFIYLLLLQDITEQIKSAFNTEFSELSLTRSELTAVEMAIGTTLLGLERFTAQIPASAVVQAIATQFYLPIAAAVRSLKEVLKYVR